MNKNTKNATDHQYYFSQTDIHNECQLHMSSNNLSISEPINANGEIQRYSADDKKNKKDEWYVAWEGVSIKGNPYLICVYGSWSEDSKYEFKSWENKKFSFKYDSKEREKIHEDSRRKKEEVEQLIRVEQDKAAVLANHIWEKASITPENEFQNRYIKKKGVQAFGIRYGKNEQNYDSIIIPVKNIIGEIRSLQFISCSQNKTYKSFLTGGQKKGNLFQIADINNGEKIYVTEGYSTGASVYEADSQPVVVAFDIGNIPNIIPVLIEKYPDSEIIIAADRNEKGEVEVKIKELEKFYPCKVISPYFLKEEDRDENGELFSDFNDLHASKGIEEVQYQLKQSQKSQVFKPYSLNDLLRMKEKDWLIEHVIGKKDIGMLYGPPGSGKTFLIIDMIIALCLGIIWANKFRVIRSMNVAYFAGEGLSGLKSRFEAAVKFHKVELPLPNFTFFNSMPQMFGDQSENEEHIKRFVDEWKFNEKQGKVEPLDIIIIDTLHTATIGADENSAKDMGKALQFCRYVANKLGCAVLLIHHTNKGDTGERGSSALRGAMDVMIEIRKPNVGASVTSMGCSKLKDGEVWEKQNFKLFQVEGTKSVAVEWVQPIDGNVNTGKQGADIQILINEMQSCPGTKYTVKKLSEVISKGENHTRQLLNRMVLDEICKNELRDPSKKASSKNPYVYWIEGG